MHTDHHPRAAQDLKADSRRRESKRMGKQTVAIAWLPVARHVVIILRLPISHLMAIELGKGSPGRNRIDKEMGTRCWWVIQKNCSRIGLWQNDLFVHSFRLCQRHLFSLYPVQSGGGICAVQVLAKDECRAQQFSLISLLRWMWL